MSILNHYQRRPSNKHVPPNAQSQIMFPSFVLGLLFGRKDTDNHALLVNDAFGLETRIDPEHKEVALELDVAKTAVKLHAMAHPNDRLVGWYRTGLDINQSSNTLHESIIIKQLASVSNKVSRKGPGFEFDESDYIHLLVDTDLRNHRLVAKAYTSVSVMDPLQQLEYNAYIREKKRRERLAKQKANQPKAKKKQKKRRNKNANAESEATSEVNSPANQNKDKEEKEEKLPPLVKLEVPYPVFVTYKEVKTVYYASESERIGLDMIIESPPEGEALDSPSLLMNDTNHLEIVLQSLLQNLDQVEEYVNMVIKGESKGDERLGWLIGEALASVPNLSPQKFEEMISNRLQDFLMMSYLGKMTKAQLMIADKINQILPSTVPGYEQT